MTPAERNLAAEVRAVEEGHHALLVVPLDAYDRPTGPPEVTVVSDTRAGKRYQVQATASPGGPIIFTCTPAGTHAYDDDHQHLQGELGIVPCKHAAVAARRLEREHLARLDEASGTWVSAAEAGPVDPTDPAIFEGLNR